MEIDPMDFRECSFKARVILREVAESKNKARIPKKNFLDSATSRGMTGEWDWLESGNARILKQPLVLQPAGFKAKVILRASR